MQNGPVTGAVYASDDKFRYYKGNEIIDGCSNDSGVNLYVTFIGYDKDEKGKDYLIGKNNWGMQWGNLGFFRIYPDTCGIMNKDYLF